MKKRPMKMPGIQPAGKRNQPPPPLPQEVKDHKREQRENLTNAFKNPPGRDKAIVLTHHDLEKICLAGLDAYRQGMLRQLNDGDPMYVTDPSNGTHHQIIGLEVFPRTERFQMTGQELITRFGFDPKSMNPKKIIDAYQLAVFKRISLTPVTEEEMQRKERKTGTSSSSDWIDMGVPDSKLRSINDLYQDQEYKVIYHAFYPLIKTKTESKGKALKELYQGLINTFFSWAMHHQEHVQESFTQKKVEEDRSKIEEKVKEFEAIVGNIKDDKDE